MQNSTGGNNSFLHIFNAKTFERMRLKMFQQTIRSVCRIEDPGFQGIGIKTGSENFFKVFLKIALENYFGGIQGL